MPSNTVPLFCYFCETTYIGNLCIEFGKDRLAAADRPSLGQALTLALHDLLASPAQVPCQTAEAPATSCAERRGVHVRRHQLHAALEARYGLVEGRGAVILLEEAANVGDDGVGQVCFEWLAGCMHVCSLTSLLPALARLRSLNSFCGSYHTQGRRHTRCA